ncbi:hypothetical protein [Streptomyces sp. NPDC047009]|uniref:hypothetical protein n=1 Tax=Streptomyces sp. NPDC047009 TaxID=3154496 RepID=UPI0034045F36
MTNPLGTPPPTAAAHHERPFTHDPGRWARKSARALRTGHVPDSTCSTTCEPVLVYERTRWGWLAWTVPGDGSPPQVPHQIGVLTPAATRVQRLALRWLTRRPAQRIALGSIPASLRFSAAAVTLISLLAGLFAASHGMPVDVVLPAILLAPLLAEHLPGRLDARAREHVRTVEGDGPCRYVQRLAALHTSLVQAAADSDRYELRRSAEVGQHLLWDAADLLQTQDTRAASAALIAREQLLLQLAHQVAQIIQRSASEDSAADADQTRASRRPMGSHPPNARPTTSPESHPTPARHF